ncbi:MAG TPA: hypothetical protein VMF57_04200 [Solirubrobacteraceae bacterium]|nr:hypothetical protein [Solirubrobacteraceae bacterium]
MIWVAWRQFRTQALTALGLLGAFAALVLVTGSHLHVDCAARSECTALSAHDTALADLLGPALLAIPALLGMFWGAPLLARELESGTYRLAWTQSVTRRRWLSMRIALVGVAALAVAGLATWLVSWWFGPIDAADMNRFAPSVFTERGIVAVGYAGFGFAFGVAMGRLTRRTLPAMAATLIGFVAARFAVTLWVRPHLLAAKQVLVSTTLGKGLEFLPKLVSAVAAPPPIPGAWTVSAVLVDRAHHPLSTARLHDLLLRACPTVTGDLLRNGAPSLRCQVTLSREVKQLITYQPPGHYWPLQALETGIFLAAALVLIAATVWSIGPRVAGKPAAGESHERTRVPLVLTSVVVIAAVTLLLSACGSNSPASSTASGSGQPTTQADSLQEAVGFSHCMRSHGVPDFPDPGTGAFKFALAPSTPKSPAFGPAYSACRHLLPNNGESGPQARSPAHINAMLAFVRCLRNHGFTTFPDPTSTGQLTHQMVTAAGINLHQPAVLQAGDACIGVTHGFITRADVARFVAGP